MMKNLTRRHFVLTAAGGLGALATSRSHAAPTGVFTEDATATKAGQRGKNTTTTVRAAAASVKLTDDNMRELHAKEKVFHQPWEGEFRASALVLDAGQRICLVSLDAQNIQPYVTRPAAKRIAAATGIAEDNILICATHSHRAPHTTDVFGGKPNAEYVRRMEEGSVLAAVKAVAAMGDAKSAQSTVLFGQSQEATVGRNSRLLLKDGSIGWYGCEEKDVPKGAAHQVAMFRRMREEMAPHQGEARQTRLQVFRLGNLALVGIPGEMFARLGLELRRRSPFRHTCILGLANEQISYIPERRAYADD